MKPKVLLSFGISGAPEHTEGIIGSETIIAINTDPEAPINSIADYVITGDVAEILPKMIKYYKANTK